MSYTEIYSFNKKGNPILCGEVKNAWRGAMKIWEILSNKYLPNDDFTFSSSYMKKVCDLSEQNIDRVDKIILFTTFDNYLIKKEDIPIIVECFNHNDYKDTSLKEQADIIQSLQDDEDCIAIGWNHNSINANNWVTKKYNVLRDNKHYFIFDEIL